MEAAHHPGRTAKEAQLNLAKCYGLEFKYLQVPPATMPLDIDLQEYRQRVAANAPAFLRPRRFVSAENWANATTQGGTRYLGMFRENEPDLPAILTHRRLLILGEPGAGKSTAAKAVALQLLTNNDANVPILSSLKGYHGDLRALLLQSVPATILDALTIKRTYILDGIDEVPAGLRSTLRDDLNGLIATDASARLVLTARQAYYAQHANAFPDGLTAYHLIEFDDDDIRACAIQAGVDPDGFLHAAREVDADEELRNPFVLTVMLERYHQERHLGRTRSENVDYAVQRLIQSRPQFNTFKQRRALKMLAVACETAARNELTEQEAVRVLLEAIEFPEATARELLEELAQSILIRTPAGISFQMRSYGEYLAAEELHDKSIDRLQELAFQGNTPLDTWLNTITYLAEMNHKVQAYFAQHYPHWLINVSPAALTEQERTKLTRTLLRDINAAGTYLVNQETFSLRRLAQLLTPATTADLRALLTSDSPHQVGNALVLLALRHDPDVVPLALQLATEHRNASPLRYSAIVALINDDHAALDPLISFVNENDLYHISIVDAIGSLCTPEDFPRVLPMLERTDAGLSAAFYHFRELKTEAALRAGIEYLIAHTDTLHGHRLDSYLEPIIDLIPTYWSSDLAQRIGQLLAAAHDVHSGKLIERIVKHVATHDQHGVATQSMIATLQREGKRPRFIGRMIAGLITPHAAQWIKEHAQEYARDIAIWLPSGAARDILDPPTAEMVRAQAEAIEAYRREHEQEAQAVRTIREEQQETIRTSRNINAIAQACATLAKEYWPDITDEQREWLTHEVTNTLVEFDLAHSITWESPNQWRHPRGLEPLLNVADVYQLRLTDDVPVVLALRSWPYPAIANYYRRYGLSHAAAEQLARLLDPAENDNVASHVFGFLRTTGHDDPGVRAKLARVALDTTRTPQVRLGAMGCLARNDTATLLILATDQDESLRGQAVRHLIEQQHQPTIHNALTIITDAVLQGAEVPFPNDSPLDWIGNITQPFAIEDLRRLRRRTLGLTLWRVTSLVTSTLAEINKMRAAAIIRDQLADTPEAWRQHFTQEADKLQRAARIEAAQATPFDEIIRRLKGATSMILLKVWCEGPTDRPVFAKLFTELGEQEIADTLDFVAGWPTALSEHQPDRWLDGCRQAIMILDGDRGRKRTKPEELSDDAKKLQRRFAKYPLQLKILRRYGIENYFPRHAIETVLGRQLPDAYFPIPFDVGIEDHFREPQAWWQRLRNFLCRRKPRGYYGKHLNERTAQHVTLADIAGTDLATILNEIKQAADALRD